VSLRGTASLRLGACAAVAALVVAFGDAWFRAPILASLSFRELREYGAALLGSWALWWGLGALFAFTRSRGVIALGGVLAFVTVFSQFAVLLAYRRLPGEEGFVFFANQWAFSLRTALAAHDPRLLALAVGLAAALALFTRQALRATPSLRATIPAVIAAIAAGAVSVQMAMPDKVSLTPDLNGVRFLGTLARWGAHPPPFFAVVVRSQPTVEVPPPPFNVLFVVHETLGAGYLRAPDGRPITPALLALRDDPAVVWLDRLQAVSSCTDVSLPAILSGVSSSAALPAQVSAALPFELAHRAGAFTFVTSAQRLSWAGIDRYLGPEHFDLFASAEALGPEDGDDEGVADELALKAALEAMDHAAGQGRRFVGLVRTNGTHGPYRVDPADSPWREDPGFGLGDAGGFVRYLNALHRLDREWGAFWQALRSRPFFDDTLVLVTADHGEAFGQHRSLWHCGGAWPEESWVPGAVRLPATWREAHPAEVASLRARAPETTFVTGLPPTLAAVLGWPALAPQFDGRPLWEPAPAPTVFTNCSDLRRCASADLGLFDQGLRWVYQGEEGRWRAFDERLDPGAAHDVAAAHAGAPPALPALLADPRTSPRSDASWAPERPLSGVAGGGLLSHSEADFPAPETILG
jgi:hypothetical protein